MPTSQCPEQRNNRGSKFLPSVLSVFTEHLVRAKHRSTPLKTLTKPTEILVFMALSLEGKD